MPSYLEASMEGLSKNAEQMRQQVADAFGGRMPFGTFEDLARHNVAMFQRAMRMFTPFRFNKDEPEAARMARPRAGGNGPRGAFGDRRSEGPARRDAQAARRAGDPGEVTPVSFLACRCRCPRAGRASPRAGTATAIHKPPSAPSAPRPDNRARADRRRTASSRSAARK